MPAVRFPPLLNLVPTPTLHHHHIRGYKVEPWEDPSLLLSISRDTLRIQQPPSAVRNDLERIGTAWLAWFACTGRLRLLPGIHARARLLCRLL